MLFNGESLVSVQCKWNKLRTPQDTIMENRKTKRAAKMKNHIKMSNDILFCKHCGNVLIISADVDTA